MSWGWGWRPYVSAAKKRAKGLRHAKALEKKGHKLNPVNISGRAITTTFWGKAWCENLERYSDFSNRLPRGRTYARNGSILDLQIGSGRVTAIVSGSDIYNVRVDIATLAKPHWRNILNDCSQSIGSLFDLLQGKLSDGVMERLTRPREGLFPEPKEIEIRCSCPDWAGLCKHAAAVMYGVGARLDTEPDLLFRLRNVDHEELIQQATDGASLDDALQGGSDGALSDVNLGELFDIELDASPAEPAKSKRRSTRRTTAARKTSAAKTRASRKKQPAAKNSTADAEPAIKKTPSKRGRSTAKKPARVKRSKSPRTKVAKAKTSKSAATQNGAANKLKTVAVKKGAAAAKRHK